MESIDTIKQEEEVEALKAIYDDDFRIVSTEQRSYAITIEAGMGEGYQPTDHTHPGKTVELMVTFPMDYPSSSPPVYEIRAPWLASSDLQGIAEHFSTIYSEDKGEVVVHRWVEWMRELLTLRCEEQGSPSSVDRGETEDGRMERNEGGGGGGGEGGGKGGGKRGGGGEEGGGGRMGEEGDLASGDNKMGDSTASASELRGHSAVYTVECPSIIHGEPLTDRKSTFQAHVASVISTAEVEAVLTELKSSRKIATATHNILAYRIHNDVRGVLVQDCDDDGESAAGGRLLHLLQIMDVQNVVVVVTRWYGGIHLHADRFKHINNVARILLQESGVGSEHKTQEVKKKAKNAKSKPGRHR